MAGGVPVIAHLLGTLVAVPAGWLLGAIAALVFGESAFFLGFVLPGETAVLFGGFLSSTGRFALVPLLVVVVAAAILGDSFGYEVGRRFGPRLLATRLMERRRPGVERARGFLEGRGAVAIFAARFTAFLRAVVPGLAGLSRMRYARFLAFNAAGGLVWGVAMVLLGYVAGSSYTQVEQWLGRSGAVVVAALVVVAVLVWRRTRSRRAAERPAQTPAVCHVARSPHGQGEPRRHGASRDVPR